MARLPVDAERKIYGMDWAEAKKSMTRFARRRAFVEHHLTRIYDIAYDHDPNLWISGPKISEIWNKVEGLNYFQFSDASIQKILSSLPRKGVLEVSKERISTALGGTGRNFYKKVRSDGKPVFFSSLTGKLDDISVENFTFNRKLHQFEHTKPEIKAKY